MSQLDPSSPSAPHLRSLSLGHPSALLSPHALRPGELLLDGGCDPNAAPSVRSEARFSALCLAPSEELYLSTDSALSVAEAIAHLEERLELGVGQTQPTSAADWRALPHPAPLSAIAMSYELGLPPSGRGAQRSAPELSARLSRLPLLWGARYEAAYVWDAERAEGWLCGRSEQSLDQLSERLALMVRAAEEERGAPNQKPNQPLNQGLDEPLSLAPLSPSMSAEEHAAAIHEAQALMRSGDLYQVNLTCALSAELKANLSPEALYLKLRARNPAPYGALLHLRGGRYVLCLSPERFIRWDSTGLVRTEPIKGTRPRAQETLEDDAQAQRLLSSTKDRAEHTMIVDLERNDLGRVCRPGSVRVETLRALKSYPSVHHLVSVITGQLREGTSLAELLEATFPGGSITGAPKRRAMEVISRLEAHPRGLYCGAIGYLSPDGSGDLNLPIRTCTVEGSALTYHAGGGVVADSTAEGEWEELWVKARAISRGLGW